MLKHYRSDWFVDPFLKNPFLSRSIFARQKIVTKTNQRNHLFEGLSCIYTVSPIDFFVVSRCTYRYYHFNYICTIRANQFTVDLYHFSNAQIFPPIYFKRKFRQIQSLFDTSNSDRVPTKNDRNFYRNSQSHLISNFWRQKRIYVLYSTSAPVGSIK